MLQPLTTEQLKPNLFDYATSELSQDAFICWLAAWADPRWKESDPALHQAGRDFVASMIYKVIPDYDTGSIKSVDIKRQADKLDVLIEVNKAMPDKLAILVEDKTHTSNHSDQLDRYYSQIEAIGYDRSEMIPLYFKTGYQSRFDTLGFFKTYLRNDFLMVLQNGKNAGVQNAIFNDFLSHLEYIETSVSLFSDKSGKDWWDDDWRGFYMKLYKSLEHHKPDWGDVPNKSGGFIGFWWHGVDTNNLQYNSYLQLETPHRRLTDAKTPRYDLSFKINVKDRSLAPAAWREASEKILKAGQQLGVLLTRPKQTTGYSMTVARWPYDYRVFSDGTLNLEATLENLKKAQQVLDLAFQP